jgi:hypothetical protein
MASLYYQGITQPITQVLVNSSTTLTGVVASGLLASFQAILLINPQALVILYNNLSDINVTLDDPLLGTSIAASFVTGSQGGLLSEVDLMLIR